MYDISISGKPMYAMPRPVKILPKFAVDLWYPLI